MLELPITEARHQLTSIPKRLARKPGTVAITRRGKPVLALLTWEFYESLMESLEILEDKELMKAFYQGIKEMREGKTVPWVRVKKDLGL